MGPSRRLAALDAYRFLGKCHPAAGSEAGARAARVELERALEIASHSGRTRQLESVHYQLAVALAPRSFPLGQDDKKASNLAS